MVEIIILIIALVWGFLSVFGSEPLSGLKDVWPSSDYDQQIEIQAPDYTHEYTPSQESESSQTPLSPATVKIVSGPYEGEVLNETNEVTFEFELKDPLSEDNVRFETKIEGFDDDWVSSYSQKRSITLPAGPKEYTFMVREKDKNQIPAQRSFKINVSPYFEKIEFDDVEAQTTSQPCLITLDTDLEKEETINITGWQIKGKGGSFVIPGGIEKYSPYYNPVPSESIVVKQGDTIYLSSASNPLGTGRNFRPNKCLGYLASYREFPIPLSTNCPKPTRQEIFHLQPCCQNFILDADRCEIPDYSRSFIIASDSECVSYINENLNYGGCFKNYSRDEDFVMEDWHIYMNRSLIFSNDCDILYLRDENNLFVDKYYYNEIECNW